MKSAKLEWDFYEVQLKLKNGMLGTVREKQSNVFTFMKVFNQEHNKKWPVISAHIIIANIKMNALALLYCKDSNNFFERKDLITSSLTSCIKHVDGFVFASKDIIRNENGERILFSNKIHGKNIYNEKLPIGTEFCFVFKTKKDIFEESKLSYIFELGKNNGIGFFHWHEGSYNFKLKKLNKEPS